MTVNSTTLYYRKQQCKCFPRTWSAMGLSYHVWSSYRQALQSGHWQPDSQCHYLLYPSSYLYICTCNAEKGRWNDCWILFFLNLLIK